MGSLKRLKFSGNQTFYMSKMAPHVPFQSTHNSLRASAAGSAPTWTPAGRPCATPRSRSPKSQPPRNIKFLTLMKGSRHPPNTKLDFIQKPASSLSIWRSLVLERPIQFKQYGRRLAQLGHNLSVQCGSRLTFNTAFVLFPEWFFPNILILSGYSFARNLSIVHPQDGVQTPKADSLPMTHVSSSSISAIYLLYTWVSAHAGHIFSILLPPAPSTVFLASTFRLGSYHRLWSILFLLRPEAEIPKCLYGMKDKV